MVAAPGATSVAIARSVLEAAGCSRPVTTTVAPSSHNGDVTGFPPTFVQAGTRDLFLSNAVRMHRKLRDAGVDAELHVWEAMDHGALFGAPEHDEIGAEIRRFLAKHGLV